ncbi:MAG: radical SAM protein [Desulfovibrionaceae bacterium]|nr:radical SAM protein [Desulfovibrionaceae bacterium]
MRSGRLGLSLGLDLLGARICSFDCLYCEVGATDALTLAQKPYVPAKRLLGELSAFAASGPPAFDVVTLGGLGEPCLNTGMDRIITGCRETFPGLPVAVLTNSSLLSQAAVRRRLALADIVLPSMDTLVPGEFAALNRPHPDLSLSAIRQGLLDFRSEYSGRLFLETLIVGGINDTAENLDVLTDFCRELRPDRVDVVTMTRPGAYAMAQPAPPDTLARFRAALGAAATDGGVGHGPAALRSRVVDHKGPSSGPAASPHETMARVAASLGRRPQTVKQLSVALGLPEDDISRAVEALAREKKIQARAELDHVFYQG